MDSSARREAREAELRQREATLNAWESALLAALPVPSTPSTDEHSGVICMERPKDATIMHGDKNLRRPRGGGSKTPATTRPAGATKNEALSFCVQCIRCVRVDFRKVGGAKRKKDVKTL